MEGISFTQYRINQYRDMFYQNAEIFDDATPNYREDENIIWESQKNFDTYVNDIQSFYKRIHIILRRADLGDPLINATIENRIQHIIEQLAEFKS